MLTRKEIKIKYNNVVIGKFEVIPIVNPDTGTATMRWYQFDIVQGEDRPENDVIAHTQAYLTTTYPNLSDYDASVTEIVVPLIVE